MVPVTGEMWICATSGARSTQSGGVSAKVSLTSSDSFASRTSLDVIGTDVLTI